MFNEASSPHAAVSVTQIPLLSVANALLVSVLTDQAPGVTLSFLVTLSPALSSKLWKSVNPLNPYIDMLTPHFECKFPVRVKKGAAALLHVVVYMSASLAG